VSKNIVAILTLVSLFLAGCEWGYKMPTGSERFAAVSPERVDILFAAPNRPFKQIGILSAMGSTSSSDVAMYTKLRKAAADLGADPVMVSGQSQGVISVPGVQTTSLVGITAITTGGSFLASYPKSQGLAIRYAN
jgi:hypothetical protein